VGIRVGGVKVLEPISFPLKMKSVILLGMNIAVFGMTQECACGIKDQQGRIWTDIKSYSFDQIPSLHSNNPDFYVESYLHGRAMGEFPYRFVKENVYLENGMMVLKVNGNPTTESINGEIGTKMNDILYGSFSSTIQMPSTPGTCFGFFQYYNDSQEIDIEYLGVHPKTLFLSSKRYQPNSTSSNIDFENIPVDRDLHLEFRKYRFDWMPNYVEFFLDDAKILTLHHSPNQPSRIVFQHWSNGNPNWSFTPTQDAFVRVRDIQFYYNKTTKDVGFDDRCQNRFCDINSIDVQRVVRSSSNTAESEHHSTLFILLSIFAVFILLLNL
jgi:beta-glucanase (GH16 family)